MKHFFVVIGAAMIFGCGAGNTGSSAMEPDFSQPVPPASVLDDFGGDFDKFMSEQIRLKPEIMARQLALLVLRYDLSNRPSTVCRMSRGRPVQAGIRARLPPGVSTWEALAMMAPDEIRARDLFPRGFMPLPHPNQPVGGMLFTQPTIDEVKRQTGRDLMRFDLDFDLPTHFVPEFPPAIYLTTRPDLGDVSRGQVLTTQNYYAMFKDILNEKQLDGLRLLLTPFAQQQFNLTDDRRVEHPSLGVACLECHVNGHTNAATHLVGDIRPQEFRRRIDTVSLRGVRIQQLFGSQRALKSVEDFTEFEQRAAYFDGNASDAIKKGANFLDRGGQVQPMAEMQELFDFPPAPKLNLYGKLGPSATAQELRGQALFNGKAQCSACHGAPDYTDQTMHDLDVSQFFTPRMINGEMATDEGPTKTFALRGIKDSPPYFHDGRLLTLDDVVEFFNLILQTRLAADEKSDLVAFLCTL